MLNEIREYMQYTGDPTVEKRLAAKELSLKLSGIERPLVILARALIRTDPDGELLNEECVVRALRLWCGLRRKKECYAIDRSGGERRWTKVLQKDFQKMTDGDGAAVRVLRMPDDPCQAEEIHLEVEEGFHLADTDAELYEAFMAQEDLRGCRECAEAGFCRRFASWDRWLIRYGQAWYPKGYENETKKKTEQACVNNRHLIEQGMMARRQSYEQSLFSSDVLEEECAAGSNTFKKITFEGILAKALTEGPLRQRYLVARNLTSTEDLGVWIRKNNGEYRKDEYTSTVLDVICKETAAYLLAGGTAGRFVVVNKTDVSNWGKSEIRNEAGKAGMLSRYLCQNGGDSAAVPLFEEISYRNVCKMKICPEWLERCGWCLASEEELDTILKEHPDCLYFRDDGGRADLTVRKRYSEETEK